MGVKFWLEKSCPCKRNNKYEVCKAYYYLDYNTTLHPKSPLKICGMCSKSVNSTLRRRMFLLRYDQYEKRKLYHFDASKLLQEFVEGQVRRSKESELALNVVIIIIISESLLSYHSLSSSLFNIVITTAST